MLICFFGVSFWCVGFVNGSVVVMGIGWWNWNYYNKFIVIRLVNSKVNIKIIVFILFLCECF